MKAAVIALAVVTMMAAPLHGRQPQSNTIAWTNSGGGYCLSMLTVNGQPTSGGQIYCPHQSTSFSLPDGGASLYIGDDILEANYNQVVRGNPLVTGFNADGTWHTYSTTDTFTVSSDTVTATENYVRTYSVRCATRSGCHKYYYDTNVGGSGTIAEN
jgi:hypothetical protein